MRIKSEKKKGNKTRADKVYYNENGYSFSHLALPFADGLSYIFHLTKKKEEGRKGWRVSFFLYCSAIYYPQRLFEKRGCPIEQFPSFLFFFPMKRPRKNIFKKRREGGRGLKSRRSWPPEGTSSERFHNKPNLFFVFFKKRKRKKVPFFYF
jgi:hypothetical protein